MLNIRSLKSSLANNIVHDRFVERFEVDQGEDDQHQIQKQSSSNSSNMKHMKHETEGMLTRKKNANGICKNNELFVKN